ncbi:MAG: HK97 gp10 family phage protein [Rhodoferax sp.]|uniref:HK97 gp10 family phage protein n=1 Tax=Rhodoferax sp. TaxID=50421 RepID=UPI0027311009|nr:HK97 gp10 family phage protein [Rhodoferax sp.]MDP1530318.1 HK97 gp10 family phage protein [Rhodoferax sp.]MDP1943335.1 HK97 gp10 family phage protein [Rhodoferax sp.]
MATVTGVHQVVFALREHGQDMERGVQSELTVLAQMAVRTMRRLAAKGATSDLVNSIKVDQVNGSTVEIGPHTHYAGYVEAGVKPGGKGLPRFFDPASKNVVDWLRSTAFKGQHKGGMGTRALQSQETELRDRYEGLAWHVRHFGVKAQPFVKPTADEMEPVVLKRLDLAVRRVLGARGGSGAATA